jgi:two-component system, LuxR family, response regulator FixJ
MAGQGTVDIKRHMSSITQEAKQVTDDNDDKVAVVDDDPAMLEAVQCLLESAGYAVSAYPSAVAFLTDPTAWPACLITDQNVPEMTGLELAAHLRTKGAVIPVLLFSGHLSASLISRAAEFGIKVVGKPAPGEELVRFVAAHIREAA